MISDTAAGATVKLPVPVPVTCPVRMVPVDGKSNVRAGGSVVTTFWNVTSANAWSATASGAPVMSGLPIAIVSVAVSRSPSVGSTSV